MDRFKNIKFDRKLVIKLILLSPIIALLIYAVFIRPVQVRLEQREFKKAEAFLEEKKNQIEALAGPADDVVKENSCGYSSAKFSKGSLGCGSSINYMYVVSSLKEANEKVNQISQAGDSVIYRLAGKANSFTQDDVDRSITLVQSMGSSNSDGSVTRPQTKQNEPVTTNSKESILLAAAESRSNSENTNAGSVLGAEQDNAQQSPLTHTARIIQDRSKPIAVLVTLVVSAVAGGWVLIHRYA